MELNEYKLKEMRVHSASRKNTLFYQVGNNPVFETRESLLRKRMTAYVVKHIWKKTTNRGSVFYLNPLLPNKSCM